LKASPPREKRAGRGKRELLCRRILGQRAQDRWATPAFISALRTSGFVVNPAPKIPATPASSGAAVSDLKKKKIKGSSRDWTKNGRKK
jgi:hypothetical protein